MIDLHCHVLPGIDDGPQTIEESLALAAAAAAGGTRTIVATSHVSSRYPNDAATIAPLVEELNMRLQQQGIDIDVRAGAEIALTHLPAIDADELARLTLGGGGWLLIEPPFVPIAAHLDSMILGIARRGHQVVVAHPERCPALHRKPEMLGALVRGGALTSVTASSFTGQFGERVRRFALALLQEDMVHNLASDAHDTLQRGPTLASEIEQAGLGELREWLTSDVPSAILDGGEIPPRPANVRVRAPGGLLARFRRR